MYLRPFNLKQYNRKGTYLSSICPWACMASADGVILGKNAALSRVYTFTAPDLGSSSADKIASIAWTFNNAIKSLGEGWALQFEVQRNYSNEYPGAALSNPAAYIVEKQREAAFTKLSAHFRSDYYLTFTYQMPGDIQSRAKNFFFRNSEIYEGLDIGKIMQEIDDFTAACDKAVSPLAGRMTVRALSNNETVEYLHSTVSTTRHKMNLPEDCQIFLDCILTDTDLETTSPLKFGDYYTPILSINAFPAATVPAILDGLNGAMTPYRWSTRFINYDRQTAKKVIEKYQKRFYGARKSLGQYVVETTMNVASNRENAGAFAQESDTNEAMQEVTMDTYGFGEYTSCVMVWDADFDAATERAKYIAGIIGAAGFTCKEETLNAPMAFQSMMPGNVYANVRKMCVSTGNVSHVIPISSVWSGMRENKFFHEICGRAVPHVVCSTEYGIPFFLNLNVGDVGHTWISGQTGAGKSTLLSLLEIQWLKYPGSRVVILDKDRSARGVTVCAGGVYIEPGKDDVAFQPLAELETPEEKRWAVEFIECLLTEQKTVVTPVMRKFINDAVNLLATVPVETRTLTRFMQYCHYVNPQTGGNEINEAVKPYSLSGQYGELFDSDMTNLPSGDWLMYEMGTL